jgi:hypothetical protein
VFTASTIWSSRLTNKQQLYNIKFIGHSAGSGALADEYFPGSLGKNVEDAGFSAKYVLVRFKFFRAVTILMMFFWVVAV